MRKLLAVICLFSILFNTTAVAQAQTINNNKVVNEENMNSSDESMWPKNKPAVNSKAAIVMEASTGAILYSKNIHHTYYPASITKILTTLIAIENCSLGEIVTFSKDAIFNVDLDSSRIGIDVGEQLTVEQSLYAILLASANEVAYGLAEHVAGDVDSFAKLMNERAAKLGAKDSHFVNPHGLPDPNHYTSAYDMALISREAINNETFRKISSTSTYTIPPTNIQKEARPLTNHHKFIKGTIPFEGALGGKTGYTSQANYTLVTYAERNGMTLISVIMNCDSIEHEYEDTAKLLNFGFDNFSLYNISTTENPYSIEPSPLFTKYNSLFSIDNSALQVSKDGNIVLPNSASFTDAKKEIKFAPIKKLVEGENTIGSISYTYDGKFVGSSNIIFDNTARPSLEESTLLPLKISFSNKDVNSDKDTKTKRILPLIIGAIIAILVIFIGLYLIFVELPYRRRRKNYRRKRYGRKSSNDLNLHFWKR